MRVAALAGIILVVVAMMAWIFSAGPMHATSTIFTLTSPAFKDGGSIPSRFTCDGEQVNPPLSITGTPAEAKSLVLIVRDPDIPASVKQSQHIEVFDHWVLFDIPAATQAIGEGETVGILGANSAGAPAYAGPCPPPDSEPSEHRYIFTLYALDTMLSLPQSASALEVEAHMQGHILAQTELTGLYKRLQQ